MSSYFDDASLVMIPSGYKTSKVYSVKPTDGSGDLTFSRSNDTATRVNSAGLIEKVRTNLLPYSQAFNDATWIKTSSGTGVNPVVTANNATAPDGTMTADTIVFNAGAGTSGSDLSEIYQTLSLSGTLYTGSFYARVTSGTGQLVFRHALGGAYTKANLTTTWQRFSSAEAFGGGTQYFEIGIRRAVAEPVNASVTVELWGAQLEDGDIATDYIPTTSAAVSVGPVANVPRLDYLNSSCPRLLLEPQRVNKWYFSESFDNAEWLKSNVTISANSAVSPDGYTNADKIVDTTANDEHRIRATTALFTITTATTFSIFAKAAEYSKFAIANLSASEYVKFNLSTGAVISTGANFSNAKIENYGNGWYRLSATTSTNGTHGYGLLNDAGDFVFTGTGTKGVFIYGAQAEEATYATSYIPTLGAAVTRGADDASKTGISSLIGQTEGTLFAEIVVNGAQEGSANIINSEKNTTASFAIQRILSGTIFARLFISGSAVQLLGGDIQLGQRTKIAFAYKTGSSALFQDGVLIASSSSAFVLPSTLDDIFLGDPTAFFGSKDEVSFNQALVFKTRLTNSELAALTTL